MPDTVTLEQMREVIGTGSKADKVVAKVAVDENGQVEIYDSTMEKLTETMVERGTTHFKPAIAKTIAAATKTHTDEIKKDIQKELDKELKELNKLARSARKVEIHSGGVVTELEGVQHKALASLLTVVNTGQPAILVGPAGTGKTHAAETVAQALGLSFHSISVGAQTSKSDLSGYMSATGSYIRTQFREAYENGGVFLLDEADAGNSNVLILLNAALSNGYMAFPDGMVQRHENFRMIATANTYGSGASRQYVGRNQLDAATLDRFSFIDWDIDDSVEAALAGTDETGRKWLAVVRAVRKRVQNEKDMRVVISPRATQRGANLLAAKMPFEKVLPIALTASIPGDHRAEMENLARSTWTAK